MPGLVGIISKQKQQNCEKQVKTMLALMQYEDFYSSGVYSNPDISVCVGWTCYPKSFCDCLPVTNQVKDLFLFFVGEVFEDRHQPIASEGGGGVNNAESLINLYEDYGEKFFEKLNGWFCGLLLDRRGGKVFLFNDRYGMNRVFIHENQDGFYFSSEAKALLAVLPDTREFDPKGVGEFLTCGCTLGNQSLYKNVSILPPASSWVFENGDIKKKKFYFVPKEWIDQQHLNEKQFSDGLIESFDGFVKRYTGGLLPVGVSLTGGLDSRMIMACLDEDNEKFPCYTFGSMYRDTFDVQTARVVAEACGHSYHNLVLGEGFIRNFPNYLERAVYISDGYLALSGAAELYLNSLVRQIAPVRLTGNYGGELLRGHRAFKFEAPMSGFIAWELRPYIHEAQKTFQELEKSDPITFALFHQAPSQGYGRLAIERSQVILRTPFMDNDLVRLVYQAPPYLLKNVDLSMAIISRHNPSLLKIPTDRGLLCNGSRLKSLTRQLYRKSLIKAEYWSSHGMPNWLATISNNGIQRLLDKIFIGRDKFQHFRLWTKKYFADYISDVLHEGTKEAGEFFNLDQIENIVNDHVAGKKNYINEIDKIMTLILARRTLFKGNVNRL